MRMSAFINEAVSWLGRSTLNGLNLHIYHSTTTYHLTITFPHILTHIFPEMHHQSRPAHFQTLFNLFAASLQEYEKQTGIALSKYPLAEQLRYSYSAESITAILQDQVPTRSEFGGTDRITKLLSSIVSVLYTLSYSVDLNWVCSKILTGLFHI
jgi:hypothetical protein